MMNAPQGSPEWLAARLGKVTASRVSDVVARTKHGWGASRANYMAELLVERLTGIPQDTYINQAMQRGIETEPEARAAYSFRTDAEVIEVGFVAHPSIVMAGASPDGYIGEDGLIEIKCPQSATHIDTLLGEPIPLKYRMQMQFQMACSQRTWCDFISYDPRMPEAMRLFIERIPRDNTIISELEKGAHDFLAELDERHEALTKRYLRKVAA